MLTYITHSLHKDSFVITENAAMASVQVTMNGVMTIYMYKSACLYPLPALNSKEQVNKE